MKLIEFLNPASHAIQLAGPDKKVISVPKNTKIVLSEWFMRYVPASLRVVRIINTTAGRPVVVRAPVRFPVQRPAAPAPSPAPIKIAPTKSKIASRAPGNPKLTQQRSMKKPVVGHTLVGNSTAYFHQAISEVHYPISNNIGVGILSYNRLPSLQRLIESIRRNTDLKQTTVFVSDESTNLDVKAWLNSQQDIIVIDNPSRLGVAGNSNRLLRCLSRFKHKLMLNDDVLVLKAGWEKFYADAMAASSIHHFCYRQNSVYGARPEDATVSNNIKTIKDKPQGSIIAFDQKAFETVGYFDERFGFYGMEHVDWSRRISQSGIQLAGFHDFVGSDSYFAISKDESAVEQRGQHLTQARELYTQIMQEPNRTYVNPSDISRVPSISYVIPYRSMSGRNDSIATVAANIRAQRFPHIEIIVSEEDSKPTVDMDTIIPAKHVFIQSTNQFCKSAAFNLGVKNVKTDYMVLHDADILIPAGYTAEMFRILQDNDGCHIGSQVLYMNRPSASTINTQHVVNTSATCEKVVDYFEGGSLGARKTAYVAIGGFDERFVGYGMEDCEFFSRLAAHGKFFNQRTTKMVHLWHDHAGDWSIAHKRNKEYMASIKDQPLVVRSRELNTTWTRKYS